MTLAFRKGTPLAGWLVLTVMVSWSACAVAQDEATAGPRFSLVFSSGESGYARIRTPQVLVTQRGTLLVVAEGRQTAHDQAGSDVILKRSTDGGTTWSALTVIASGRAPFPDDGKPGATDAEKDAEMHSLNAGCIVQHRQSGRILVIRSWMPSGYQKMEYRYLSEKLQAHQKEYGLENAPTVRPGFSGPDVARCFLVSSDDDGRTWSSMRDITASAKLPPPALACAPGPGIAIELAQGAHAGRIVVPMFTRWLDETLAAPDYRCRPYAIISDDGGRTWQRSKLPGVSEKGNPAQAVESQLVELPHGRIMMNARARGRYIAYSDDGGRTWSQLQRDRQLEGPDTAAGLLRYSGLGDGQTSRILFSYPSRPDRQRGVVYLSDDDGATWPVSKVLRAGRFSYSCLARLGDGRIACVFDGTPEAQELAVEGDEFSVLLATFTLDWLTDDDP